MTIACKFLNLGKDMNVSLLLPTSYELNCRAECTLLAKKTLNFKKT